MAAKVSSYLGFAKKSGKLVIGTDNLLKCRVPLILVSDSLSSNAKKKLESHAKKSGSTILVVGAAEYETFAAIYAAGVLALGVSDKNLSSAIIQAVRQVQRT